MSRNLGSMPARLDRRRESDLGHLEGATAGITYDVRTYKPGARNLPGGKVVNRRAR